MNVIIETFWSRKTEMVGWKVVLLLAVLAVWLLYSALCDVLFWWQTPCTSRTWSRCRSSRTPFTKPLQDYESCQHTEDPRRAGKLLMTRAAAPADGHQGHPALLQHQDAGQGAHAQTLPGNAGGQGLIGRSPRDIIGAADGRSSLSFLKTWKK